MFFSVVSVVVVVVVVVWVLWWCGVNVVMFLVFYRHFVSRVVVWVVVVVVRVGWCAGPHVHPKNCTWKLNT